MDKLGKAIRLLRHQKGWHQGDVAKRLEISIPALSKIETGVTDLNISRLNQIAKVFNLTPVQLLSYSETEEIKEHADELKVISEKILCRDGEIIQLQKKLIQLYDQLYKHNNV
ncbi:MULTISPECIES: helix-turn-helix domain-containing protein [Sphingobacterium]|jgi:transcriptional regulator with XRE-family HTH domain|uniref:helix-turn-helix domain-containing protein n=1 Tax=Sphingobacterium TaxID=28453 RepID=UPI00257B3835|nr:MULTISPECIES: helix-turn-helix transcriptional regulator [Sphingobacterium]MDF2849869.1 transcriptional regulator [Sphingobacterium multivorum]